MHWAVTVGSASPEPVPSRLLMWCLPPHLGQVTVTAPRGARLPLWGLTDAPPAWPRTAPPPAWLAARPPPPGAAAEPPRPAYQGPAGGAAACSRRGCGRPQSTGDPRTPARHRAAAGGAERARAWDQPAPSPQVVIARPPGPCAAARQPRPPDPWPGDWHGQPSCGGRTATGPPQTRTRRTE